MKTEINLQDAFLNTVRQQGAGVTVFLMNGFQMRGIVRGFDSFVVILEVEGRQQMVYKHAISTLAPQQKVDFYINNGKRDDKPRNE
jgi:host factor-I protein